jgi:hypothetical protein
MPRMITFVSRLLVAILGFVAVAQPAVAQNKSVTTYASNPVERKANYAWRMGRYTVQGYRIRLDYDDGYSAIHGFAISPNDPNFLIVGTDAFYVSKP